MIDYLAIATGAHEDMTGSGRALVLVKVSGYFKRKYREAAAMDLQIAINNAFRVGQLGVAGENVEMFRRAA